MTFHISDTMKIGPVYNQQLPTDDNSPFTFSVNLVLREGDIVVIDVHTTI